MTNLQEHYATPGMQDRLYSALRGAGMDLERLNPDELKTLDEFHLRGREATNELLQQAGFNAGDRLLDVGSGIGGPSRYLALATGAHVTGIDLTEEYCEIASDLARRTGLSDRVSYQSGNALEMPFDDGAFTGAWLQHVNMNISDKEGLFREIARVLAPGGKLALHEIVAGEGGELYFPVPWATDPAWSHVVPVDRLQNAWAKAGFEVAFEKDDSKVSTEWMSRLVSRDPSAGPPPPAVPLLFGERAPEIFGNAYRNLVEDRIRVFMAVLVKS